MIASTETTSTFYAVDYNMALDHEADTASYLHTDNATARKYLKSKMVTTNYWISGELEM